MNEKSKVDFLPFIDLEKAYDRMYTNAMRQTLEIYEVEGKVSPIMLVSRR